MPDPGRGGGCSLSRARLAAEAIGFRNGGKDVIAVGGRHHKAQQLCCQVVLALCQGQLRQQKRLNARPGSHSVSSQGLHTYHAQAWPHRSTILLFAG